jgi:hypothetical protein
MGISPANPTVGIIVIPVNTTTTPTQTLTVTGPPTILSGTETEVWGAATVSAPNDVNVPGGFKLTASVSGATRTDAA